MNKRQRLLLQAFLGAVHPRMLGLGILFYALGAGIAAYLGNPIDWPVYFIGQAALLLLQIAGDLLVAYFDRSNQPPFESYPRRPAAPEEEEQPILPRIVFLQAALAVLTAGAVLTALLLAQDRLGTVGLLLLGLALLLVIAFAVPPFRLVVSGYGELVQAFLLANLFPALAFFLQTGELHRLLALLTFPLTFLTLAAQLARELRGYGGDVRTGRTTMLTRLGWQRGMLVHNLLLAAGYSVLALSTLAGLELRLAWPAFLTLPLALFLLMQMNRIAGGAKPGWRTLHVTADAMLALTVYLLALAVWVN